MSGFGAALARNLKRERAVVRNTLVLDRKSVV